MHVSIVFFSESCPREVTHESRGTYIWYQVPHGIVISIECSRSPTKYASRECVLNEQGTAVWNDPDTSACELVCNIPSLM